MGFVKRQSKAAAATQQFGAAADVFVVADTDLAACASALAKMEAAVFEESDAVICAAAREIAWAGGVRPEGDFMRWLVRTNMENPNADPLDRPWWWLARVADEALQRDDPRLAGRVGFFVFHWQKHIAPRMGIADQEDCGG
jgi:hypothetical protein